MEGTELQSNNFHNERERHHKHCLFISPNNNSSKLHLLSRKVVIYYHDEILSHIIY